MSGIDHLRPYYNWSSNQVHGGSHGFNFLGVPKADQEKILFIGPSNYGVTDPIQSAALSLMHTTMSLLSSIKYSEVVKELDILGRFSYEVGDTALEITMEFEQE